MKYFFLLLIAVVLNLQSNAQTAAFTTTGDSGCVPLCVTFLDQSSNAVNWSWDFGDASAPAMVQNPTHCYISPGSYTVTLTVTFANSSTGTATGIINSFANPTASFSWSNVGGNTIAFTDQSVGAVMWMWYFGDQTTSALQNPVHTYANPGAEIVMLEVTSIHSCYASDSGGVTVLVGINDPGFSVNWNVYPNPSDNGLFRVKLNNPKQVSEMVHVENTMGQCVLSKEISDDAILDLSAQPPGCYFVRIGDGSAQKILIR